MSVNIKKEKVVNENLDDEFSDSSYITNDCPNENNLRLLLSLSRQESEVQQSLLESQIVELKNSIATLESEIQSLKHSIDESSNVIAEKNKFLNIVYSTIDNLEVKENIPVINPKTAVLKLNQYQSVTKELRDQVVDNKIILMTLCRILGCSNTKIVQSLKDLINENETIKQKFKVYEQFYQRSVTSINQMSSDLHLNGYDKAISTVNNVNTACSIHSESFDNWSMKMANLRSKCLNKSEKINPKSTSYMSKSQEINHQLYTKQQMFREDAYMKNNFYRNFPPPLPLFPYPLTSRFSLLPTPNICSFPRNPQFRNDSSSLIRPSNCTIPNTPKIKNVRSIPNKYHANSDLILVEKENPEKSSITTNFEINSNVFDWQNCSSEEAKEELSKLEKKMLEDLSTITSSSSSNATRCASPSISLVEDKSEIWDYDSGSDSDCVETKRSKWGV